MKIIQAGQPTGRCSPQPQLELTHEGLEYLQHNQVEVLYEAPKHNIFPSIAQQKADVSSEQSTIAEDSLSTISTLNVSLPAASGTDVLRGSHLESLRPETSSSCDLGIEHLHTPRMKHSSAGSQSCTKYFSSGLSGDGAFGKVDEWKDSNVLNNTLLEKEFRLDRFSAPDKHKSTEIKSQFGNVAITIPLSDHTSLASFHWDGVSQIASNREEQDGFRHHPYRTNLMLNGDRFEQSNTDLVYELSHEHIKKAQSSAAHHQVKIAESLAANPSMIPSSNGPTPTNQSITQIADSAVSDLLVRFKYREDYLRRESRWDCLDPTVLNESSTSKSVTESETVSLGSISAEQRGNADHQSADLSRPSVSKDSCYLAGTNVCLRAPKNVPDSALSVPEHNFLHLPMSRQIYEYLPDPPKPCNRAHEQIGLQHFGPLRELKNRKEHVHKCVRRSVVPEPPKPDNYRLQFLRPADIGQRFDGNIEEMMAWDKGKFAEEPRQISPGRRPSITSIVYEMEASGPESDRIHNVPDKRRSPTITIKEVQPDLWPETSSHFDILEERGERHKYSHSPRLSDSKIFGVTKSTPPVVPPDYTIAVVPDEVNHFVEGPCGASLPLPNSTFDVVIEALASDAVEAVPSAVIINGVTYCASTPGKARAADLSPRSSPLRSRGSVRFDIPPPLATPPPFFSSRNSSVECVRGTPTNASIYGNTSSGSSPITSIVRKVRSGIFANKLSEKPAALGSLSGVSGSMPPNDTSPVREGKRRSSTHDSIRSIFAKTPLHYTTPMNGTPSCQIETPATGIISPAPAQKANPSRRASILHIFAIKSSDQHHGVDTLCEMANTSINDKSSPMRGVDDSSGIPSSIHMSVKRLLKRKISGPLAQKIEDCPAPSLEALDKVTTEESLQLGDRWG